jgi:NADPH:quinone reductase-like Zn-dependent oxidoreductase
MVRSLGADIVVPRGDDIAAAIRKVAPDGVDGLADGSFQSELAVGAVRDGGAFASVRGWSGDERGIVFHRTQVRDYNHRADLLDRLRRQVEDGRITLRVAMTYPPERAAEAHRRLESKGTRGRLVLAWKANSLCKPGAARVPCARRLMPTRLRFPQRRNRHRLVLRGA